MSWLYVPETYYPSAPESEASSSGSNSPSHPEERLAAASVTWRGKLLPLPLWSRRWRAGGFIRLLSGLTCSPSMLDRGVAAFISSLPEIPARTTALRGNEQGQAAIAFLRPKSAVSPKSAGLILSSGRTSQGTPMDSSRPSLQHWKGWATALRQEYSVRLELEIPCGASDCSSWPSASDVSARGGSQPPAKRKAGGHAVNLEDVAENWAAPQARDHFPAHSLERIAAMKAQGHGMRNLNDEAATWHAPRANDPEKRGQISDDQRNGIAGQAEHWKAPNVPNGGRSTTHAERKGNTLYHEGQKVQENLEAQAKNWATPAARDHKGSSQDSLTRQDGKVRNDMLDYQAEQFSRPPSSQDRQIAGGAMSSTDTPNSNQPSAKRKLNPIFVEALMRWPTGLSGFERAETAWTRWWQQQLSYLSALHSPQIDAQPDLFGDAA